MSTKIQETNTADQEDHHTADHSVLDHSPWTRMGAKLARAHKLFAATLPAHEHEADASPDGKPSHTPEEKAELLDSRFPLAVLGNRVHS